MKKLISCILVLSLAFVISLVTACEQKPEIKEYKGEVIELSEYEGNYSILVKVSKENFSDDQLTIGLNSDMELVDSKDEALTPDKFVRDSKITFYTSGELLLSYPPILNGTTKVVLEE